MMSDDTARQDAEHLDQIDRLGAGGDDFYVALLAAHDGLSDAESAHLNARLILLLANEVGDHGRLKAAIARAMAGIGRSGERVG